MTQIRPKPDEYAVLAEAALAAAESLGLSQADLGTVIGRDRSRIRQGIRTDSKSGELALMLIRCYRGLYALVDGDTEVMRHWMVTSNRGTGGVPAEQIQSIGGLTSVLGYLDAIRGKV